MLLLAKAEDLALSWNVHLDALSLVHSRQRLSSLIAAVTQSELLGLIAAEGRFSLVGRGAAIHHLVSLREEVLLRHLLDDGFVEGFRALRDQVFCRDWLTQRVVLLGPLGFLDVRGAESTRDGQRVQGLYLGQLHFLGRVRDTELTCRQIDRRVDIQD